jgi:hypothetical protein
MTEWTRSIALVVACSLLAWSRPSLAEPPADAVTEAPAATTVSEASVRAALAEGDLETARVDAMALREADPTLAHWLLEADVHVARGDHASERAALEGARASVPEQDASEREAIDLRLAALDERSRGRVVDEPASTHRERLDAERAERLAALQPAPPVVDAPVDVPPPPVPIVKKWYFWVTLGSIVGAAVAITAVAIDANVGNSSGDARLPPAGPAAGGLTLLRF